jgi:hypothetical protein
MLGRALVGGEGGGGKVDWAGIGRKFQRQAAAGAERAAQMLQFAVEE